MSSTPRKDLLSISDAVEAIRNPVLALQAIEQLTHPTSSPPSIDLSLVNREALAYLLTTIHKDLANSLAEAQEVILASIENSKTSCSTGDAVTAPQPMTAPRPLFAPCRHRKE